MSPAGPATVVTRLGDVLRAHAATLAAAGVPSPFYDVRRLAEVAFRATSGPPAWGAGDVRLGDAAGDADFRRWKSTSPTPVGVEVGVPKTGGKMGVPKAGGKTGGKMGVPKAGGKTGGETGGKTGGSALRAETAGKTGSSTSVASATHLAELDALVEARAARVPLQYLTGWAGFRTLALRCRPGVFVPRPETELLAGLAIDLAGPAATVAEPCTGSGAVALALAAELPGVTVYATDRSKRATRLARDNLDLLARGELGPRGPAQGASCTFLHGDLLAPLPRTLAGRVDVVVANPPYLTAAEHAACPPEVRDHEPTGALVDPPDGWATARRLARIASRWLRPGGWLLLELAEERVALAAAWLAAQDHRDVSVHHDLNGRPRVVASRPGGEA